MVHIPQCPLRCGSELPSRKTVKWEAAAYVPVHLPVLCFPQDLFFKPYRVTVQRNPSLRHTPESVSFPSTVHSEPNEPATAMGVVGHGTDRDNRMGPVSGLVDNLNLFFPGRKDKSTAPIALVRKGEEGVCSGGWNCLSQGQQVGILFSAILFSVSLILAMAYYCHNRKNQGWTDDDENIIPMRPIQRKRSDDKMRRSRSIVSRHTSYSLPTIPGVQPPQYNAIVPLRQPTVYSYIQGQNPILLPAPPIHALQPALGPVQSNQGTAVRAMQGQPNYRPIQLQVGLPMPRQTWYEAQYHECGKSPGYTSLAQRFLQLCRMPYGRAETISSSRPQSRSNLTERRQSQESRFSAVSAEAAPEGHRNEGRPTDDCAVTASPQSHIATVYSDDFLLPHHPEQAGESTRSDADAREFRPVQGQFKSRFDRTTAVARPSTILGLRHSTPSVKWTRNSPTPQQPEA
ncbi:hypothetical protein SODALDRAFT_177869 [Sodiomyces alkalinus F11]|uniref:Uncharacterized protein n=1 Tax=Sodiomyces alkalinus (strain CBS 110278 / VKM F-3762 / F11) TaxID=1314773 RepID=A0A3N2PTY9_SODAK|nr:hypothetical protein SODALDRAFT_177869 [Sodiomyces alkalinus F11]ROT37941.1 hypothetical protein SODALDRAFT_177869 [Sodiomyces alkalinus F11]